MLHMAILGGLVMSAIFMIELGLFFLLSKYVESSLALLSLGALFAGFAGLEWWMTRQDHSIRSG
jgi:hypothetical protein